MMSIVRKARRLLGLSRDERVLLLWAVPTVAIVRVGLWLLHPSYVLRRVESYVGGFRDRGRPSASVAEIAWSVRAASRRLPGASCLVQALAARLLLSRHGHDSTLRIGVAKGNGEVFEAHAWIEVEGVPVMGGREVHRYKTLPDFAGALPIIPKRFRSDSWR